MKKNGYATREELKITENNHNKNIENLDKRISVVNKKIFEILYQIRQDNIAHLLFHKIIECDIQNLKGRVAILEKRN